MAEFRFEVASDTGTVLASSGDSELQYDVLLESVETHRRLDKVGIAELVFVCPNLAKEANSVDASVAPFSIGGSLIIKAAAMDSEGGELEQIFVGMVTRSQLRNKAGMFELKLTLKDYTIALARKKKARLFKEMSDADIVAEIVGDENKCLTNGGLSSDAVHEQQIQMSVSDWDYLRAMAYRNGSLPAPQIADGEIRLDFIDLKKFSETSSIAVDKQNVQDFCVQYNGEFQYTSNAVDAWDLESQALFGEQSFEASALSFKALGKSLSESGLCVDESSFSRIEDGIMSEGESLANAEGELSVIASCSHSGYIQMDGNTDHQLGDGVSLNKVSDAFSGPFLVSGIVHNLSSKGWFTRYELGMKPQQLALSLLDHVAGPTPALENNQGLHIGVVADFEDDPKAQFRIPVKLQKLPADSEAIWARVAMSEAGGGRGVIFWPEAGDEVVVSFVGGDYRCPIIVGSLFSPSANKVPEGYEPSEENHIRGIVTKTDMRLSMDNTEELVEIILDDETNVCLQTSSGLTAVIAQDSQSTVGGLASFKVEGEISVEAGDAMSVSSASDFTLSSDGALELSAASGADIKSDASASFESGAGMDVKAGAAMNVKGSVINLN